MNQKKVLADIQKHVEILSVTVIYSHVKPKHQGLKSASLQTDVAPPHWAGKVR